MADQILQIKGENGVVIPLLMDDNGDGTYSLATTGAGGGGGSAGTEFAEDAAHSSGALGTLALVVRRDADTSLVDTTGDYAPLQVDANGYLKVAIKASTAGGLTDTELRATPVPVSGTVTASGPLTDAQLRASAVPVSGPVTDAQLRATAVPVSGTVTASGPLTDAQLRATAVPVASSSKGYTSGKVSVTRTADTNAYAANDVLGPATGSTAAITFPNMGPAAGGEVIITSAAFERDASAIISGETSYTLHLYSVTPPSALGDNAAFDLPSGDRASYLGSINLGTPVDLGSTLYVAADGINKQITLASGSLFGYLVTVGGYAPTSGAVHQIALHAVGA